MNECAYQESNAADLALSRTLDQIRAKHAGDAVFLKRFNAAQEAWHQFRDAEIGSIYAHDNTPGRSYGSAASMCFFGTRAALTKARIKALQPWLVGVPSGYMCTGEYPEGDPGVYPNTWGAP